MAYWAGVTDGILAGVADGILAGVTDGILAGVTDGILAASYLMASSMLQLMVYWLV